MQNTQKNTSAEVIVHAIWGCVNKVRGNFTVGEIFTPLLAVLYAMHKGYSIRVCDNRYLEFNPNDDKLYCDLVNLVPNDKHLHYALIRFLEEIAIIDHGEFCAAYVEVLRGLFDLVSSSSGREGGEFYTPTAITKLMAYIVNKEQCNVVFDPFCGTASIVHELSQFGEYPQFIGQELNYKTSILARLNAEARYGHAECIANVNSIIHWDNLYYDAVVSCPPFGIKLTEDILYEARQVTPDCPCRSYEEIILTRPFYCNHAKLTVTHLSSGFCFRGNREYELRRELVERNLIDAIIALPANILYGTSLTSILLICKNGRDYDEPIKFIHAEDYTLGDRWKRIFDYAKFVKMIEGDARDVVKVTVQEIRQFDYNLNPCLYNKIEIKLKDGQKMVRLENLLTPVEGERIPSSEVKEIVSSKNLSRDFIEIRLNNGKLSKISEDRRITNYRSINASEDKYLLSISGLADKRYGINTEGKGFVCPIEIKVYKINENLVTPEFLAYTLVNNNAISKGGMPLSGFMKLPIVIESLSVQKEIVNKITQEHAATVRAEQEADAKRLGVKQNISDLEHLLQTTQANIDGVLYDLEEIYPEDKNYHFLLKSLKDNVEYMKRVIRFSNTSISAEMFYLKEYDIEEFVKEYCNAWLNFSGNYFSLSLHSSLGENKEVMFDKTYLKLMLDSILTNVERHGFKKHKSEDNLVEISMSLEKYEEKPYVVIRVANNGVPFKSGFTMKDYITRGRYSANTGRSGLGGYHVYQIAKGHNGFLYLDSNKIWNVIVEVLLPISNVDVNNLPIYEHECI